MQLRLTALRLACSRPNTGGDYCCIFDRPRSPCTYGRALPLYCYVCVPTTALHILQEDSHVIFAFSWSFRYFLHVATFSEHTALYSLLHIHLAVTFINKAVIDRRLRPRCCHAWSYFMHTSISRKDIMCYSRPRPRRPKSRPVSVSPFARNGYSCAPFVAKSKAARGLCFDQLGGHVELPWLMRKHDVIHKTGST